MKIKLEGRGITKGKAEGEAVVTREPISFWGGLDRETGEIVDRNHELAGVNVKGKILVFPTGKGSTGGSRTLYASAKKGTAPAAIINVKAESIIATGAIVAGIPLVDRLDKDPITTIETGDYVWVDADTGIVLIEKKKT
jgi:predicted aconitase with swiveling domain